MRFAPAALATLALLAAWPVAAQRAVPPGGVATVLVSVPAPAAATGDSVTYRVEMADGFQLYAPARGVVTADSVLRLPLTFGVGPAVVAGPVEAGRVVARWPGGAEVRRPFEVRVEARYELRFWIGADEITAPPGRPVELGYYVGNRGNAVDTVDLEVRGPDGWVQTAVPARVVLEPGDTAAGTVQIVPHEDTPAGEDRVVHVVVAGRESREARSARVVVIGETRWFGDLASLPSTVFVGSTTGTQGLGGVAVRAAGAVSSDTRMTFDFRHLDQPFAAPALRRSLGGPRLRLALTSSDWSLAAGDVFSAPDLFIGPSLHGRGVDLEWDDASKGAALLVSTPANGLGDETGHIVRGTGSLHTDIGSFSAVASSVRRDGRRFEGFSIRSAGLEYRVGGADNRLTLQAGAMEVAGDSSGSQLGPALEARYFLLRDDGSLRVRLRTVPATVPRTAAYGDELLLSGNVNVVGGLSVIGWGFATRSPLLGTDRAGTSSGLAAGARYAFDAHATQLQLTGRLRETTSPSGTRTARRSLHATADIPIGPMVAELDTEIGRTTVFGGTGRAPVRLLRAGVRWTRRAEWASAGIGYRDLGFGEPAVFVDVAGATRIGAAELRGGLSTDLARDPATATSLWSAATIELTRDLAATLGLDYTPVGAGDRWRVSLGLSRQFALPLPLAREPSAHGVVYEDRNGDRVRNADEPVIPDITVRLGALSAVTDENGEFAFMDPVRGALRIETAELPLGLIVPADVHLPARGYMEIPVVRTAALELILFLDRDGDGEWDDAEAPADGAVVSVVAPNGRTRDVAVDAEGRARMSALSPGTYTLRIHPPSTRTTGGAPVERELIVPPGGTVQRTIAIPLRQREIRMPGQGPPG